MSRIAYDFHDFDLLVEPERVRLLAAAAGARTEQGEVSAPFQLPADLDLAQIEELVMQTLAEALDRRHQVSRSDAFLRAPREAARAMGQSLFGRLFPAASPLLYKYLASFIPPSTAGPDRVVRMRLRLRLSPRLAHIPWEILYAAENVAGAELALTASIVRCPTAQQGPAGSLPLRPPLNVLLVADNPDAPEQRRLQEQAQIIHDALAPLADAGLVHVSRLMPRPEENSTLQALARTLEEDVVHVLHFMGHGYYDALADEPVGYLVMTRDGQRYDYTGQEVAAALAAGVARQLRLVVLNACEGARDQPAGRTLEFTGVAQALLDAGIPAVLAMQYEIGDIAARALAEDFYRRLVETGSIDEAVRHSRYYLLESITDTLEWVTPVLFLAGPDSPFVFTAPVVERVAAIPHQFAAYVEEKTRGFIGREYVFAAVDAFIDQNGKGYFEIEGDPGVGKSAILAELVRRRGAVSHFNIRALGVNSARHFLENVCTQLIQRYDLPYSSLPPEATRDGSFLAQLLEQAAGRLHPGEKLVVAVDALDEVEDPTAEANSPANILYLPRVLPDGVYFIMTRRQFPHTLVVDQPYQLFDLMAYADESAQDVQIYIWRAVENSARLRQWIDNRPRPLSREEFVVEMTRLSERNFMYLHHVLPAIERGDYEDLNITALPAGLEGYYRDHWARMRAEYGPEWETRIKIIYVLSEAQEPIGAQLIAEFAGSRPLPVSRVLREWDEFLREEPVDGATRYSIYHASFRDFLHRQDIVASAGLEIRQVHGMIADRLWSDLFDPPEEG
jgi:CHAT domain-containing protein